MSKPMSPEEQQYHAHIDSRERRIEECEHPKWEDGYYSALIERAIPAEQALQVAMEYINAVRRGHGTYAEYEALRANPITAKMLEE
jgi:hypothetical protein